MKWSLVVLVMLASGAAQAVELQLPGGARQVVARDTSEDRYFAPIAPFAQGELPHQVIDGAVARSAWRVDVAGLTPLQLITPLREQLLAAGYRIALDCAAETCGGYDFRFATEVLPAPSMYVNIRNYHVLSALRGPRTAPSEAVTVLVSASGGASFVQIIQAGGKVEDAQINASATTPEPDVATAVTDAPNGTIAAGMQRDGHAVLAGLDFQSGTSELGAGPFEALQALAEVMQAQPDLRVVLVGHTDNVGGLDGNIALSVNRARAVRARLIDRYAIPAAQLEAQGMGYLAPHTTNQTEAGREANRRVEAVLLAP